MPNLLSLAFFTGLLHGGPVEFGKAEFQRAAAAKGLPAPQLKTSITGGPAESYRIQSGEVTGADERGLMYGLLEAAEQLRRTGRISPATGAPQTPMRGIRKFLHNHDLEESWYYSRDYWDSYIAMLARNRFNRFNLVFAHQTHYLAPPYPFWFDLPEFPTIRAKGVSAEQKRRNLDILKYISDQCAEHGIDFTLGIWEHDIQKYRQPPMVSMVDGLTRDNIGPYSHAALKHVLTLCPSIRSVQFRTNTESGIPVDQQVEFYRDYVFPAVKAMNGKVILDVRGWTMHPDLLSAAKNAGVLLRMSTKHWGEDMGRPYQPAETYPRYSFINFLEKPRSYEFYWEIWALGSHRLLIWGSPDHVRRTVSGLRMSGSVGFEIDEPLAQKGFDNRPGRWEVFTASQKDRIFWKHEFERYWAYYGLWGRLSYNPSLPDTLFQQELQRRFGDAANDVETAYQTASRVINEIVAAHLADPNMYIWPEINPGGLVSTYKDVQPSDWRYIARMREAVRNRLDNVASAKQTPFDTAALLDGLAKKTENALASARGKVPAGNTEWRSSEPDFQVLAAMARYHARKQKAAYHVIWFYETGSTAALASARAELEAALAIWRNLVKLTDGLYPDEMAFGPADVGHWKHKLPYVEHDVAWVEELERTATRYGQYEKRFDFGGPVTPGTETPFRDYRDGPFIRFHTVEPRFELIHPETLYSDAAGYGWIAAGRRTAKPMPAMPYAEAAAVAAAPKRLPRNVLCGDYIEGSGAQIFRVRTGTGTFEVRLLKPDGSDMSMSVTAANGLVDVPMPAADWQVSGIVLRNSAVSLRPAPADAPRKVTPRPQIAHQPIAAAKAGTPVTLSVRANPATGAARIRLHYRRLGESHKFQMIESAGPAATFTIPAADIQANWDFLYYFEVLNAAGSGWFHPDPAVTTPYYVVTVN